MDELLDTAVVVKVRIHIPHHCLRVNYSQNG